MFLYLNLEKSKIFKNFGNEDQVTLDFWEFLVQIKVPQMFCSSVEPIIDQIDSSPSRVMWKYQMYLYLRYFSK